MESTKENMIVLLSTNKIEIITQDLVRRYLTKFRKIVATRSQEGGVFLLFHESIPEAVVETIKSALHGESLISVIERCPSNQIRCIESHFEENKGSLLTIIVDKDKEAILRFALDLKGNSARSQDIEIKEYSEHIRTESNGG